LRLEAAKAGAEETLEILDESYEWQKNYLDESVLMQIDPYEKPVARITYMFHAKDADTLFRDPADEVISGYINGIGNDDSYAELAKKYNTDAAYIRELTSFDCNLNANSITLEATGSDKEMAEAVLAVLEKELKNAIKADKTHAEVVLTASTVEQFLEDHDSELAAQQKKIRDAAAEALVSLQKQENELRINEIEIERLNKTKKKYDEAVDNEYKKLVKEQEAQTASTTGKFKKSIKSAFIGFIVGILIGGIWYAVAYVINPILRKDSEITEYYGFSLLGSFSKAEKKNPIDRLLQKIEKVDTSQPETMILNNTALMIQAKAPEVTSILLMGTISKEKMEEMAKKLKLVLPTIAFETVAKLSNTTEDLKKVIDAQDIIIVEEREYSSLNDIDKEVAIIKAHDKNMIGFITE